VFSSSHCRNCFKSVAIFDQNSFANFGKGDLSGVGNAWAQKATKRWVMDSYLKKGSNII